MLRPGEFYMRTRAESGAELTARGNGRRRLASDRFQITETDGKSRSYPRLEDVPADYRDQLSELMRHEGVEHKSLFNYVRKHGSLPQLDWFTLVAFAAIAGSEDWPIRCSRITRATKAGAWVRCGGHSQRPSADCRSSCRT